MCCPRARVTSTCIRAWSEARGRQGKRGGPARGELHLVILIETMRREGYEFQVARPEVIYHQAEDGEMLEPYEEVHIETSPESVGAVVEMLGSRRGQMLDTADSGQDSGGVASLAATARPARFRAR